MATQGFLGIYVETRDYSATSAFWRSLGFVVQFETDHGSGQWVHPSGGPFVFIAQRDDRAHPLETHPILGVGDSTAFAQNRSFDYVHGFEARHWGVVEATIADPDGRPVSLQAPLPEGVENIDAEAHHREKYGS